jgi:hypothetical protein
MVDPETSIFGVHWEAWDDERQTGEMFADGGEIEGAEAAIAWGRERCDRVLIRLAHSDEGHFSAGRVQITERTDGGRAFPTWPPASPPSDGWWTPSDKAVAWDEAVERARREAAGSNVQSERERPDGPWTGLD